MHPTWLSYYVFSTLLSHAQTKPCHIEAVKYLGKYIHSTSGLGLHFTSKANSTVEAYVHFPLSPCSDTSMPSTSIPSIHTFSDANWGPQDASKLSPTNIRPVSLDETKSICGHVFFANGCPILWKTHREQRTSRSSCEAEIKAIDECVKNAQMFRHLLQDLQLLDPMLPIPVYNDNHGSVDWSNSFSTKGMRHVNIWENAVREARLLNEVSISHIAGSTNPADLFTKEFKSDVTFRSLRDLLLSYPSSILTWSCALLWWGVLGLKFQNLKWSISNLKLSFVCQRGHTWRYTTL